MIICLYTLVIGYLWNDNMNRCMCQGQKLAHSQSYCYSAIGIFQLSLICDIRKVLLQCWDPWDKIQNHKDQKLQVDQNMESKSVSKETKY